jgi:hypothetical protein
LRQPLAVLQFSVHAPAWAATAAIASANPVELMFEFIAQPRHELRHNRIHHPKNRQLSTDLTSSTRVAIVLTCK